MADFNMTTANDPAGITSTYPSPMRVYSPATYDYQQAEDDLHAAYDGETPLVAVECWDHPFADGDRGAWLVGTRTAVIARLEAEKLDDWDVQCELFPQEEF